MLPFFGKLDTIQKLIDNGADFDERDSFDRTELLRDASKRLAQVRGISDQQRLQTRR